MAPLSQPFRPGHQSSLAALAGTRHPSRGASARPEPRRASKRWLPYLGLGLLLSVGVVLARGLVKASSPPAPMVLHGTPGFKHTPDGQGVRWHRGSATVYLDASVSRLGEGASEAIQNAFGAWLGSGVPLPQLTIDSSAQNHLVAKRDGKNAVLVGPITVPGHERDLAVTMSYWDEDGGGLLEADIIINSRYQFQALQSDDDGRCSAPTYDLQNVLTHEVGHFLGLGEDFDEHQATMFASSKTCETHKRSLESTDTEAATRLYLGAEDEEVAAGCAFKAAPGGGDSWGWLLLGVPLTAMARRLRRRPSVSG